MYMENGMRKVSVICSYNILEIQRLPWLSPLYSVIGPLNLDFYPAETTGKL